MKQLRKSNSIELNSICAAATSDARWLLTQKTAAAAAAPLGDAPTSVHDVTPSAWRVCPSVVKSTSSSSNSDCRLNIDSEAVGTDTLTSPLCSDTFPNTPPWQVCFPFVSALFCVKANTNWCKRRRKVKKRLIVETRHSFIDSRACWIYSSVRLPYGAIKKGEVCTRHLEKFLCIS